ncbi:MAG: TolC family protein [Bacteroidota bacterium]
MNTVQKLYLVLLFWSYWLALAGQGTGGGVVATGQDDFDAYIKLLMDQNPEIAAARIDQRIAEQTLAAAGLERRPTVNLVGDYTAAIGGRTIAFPVGDLFNPIGGALNQLTSSQDFPTNLENVDELLAPNNFYDVRFEARLPIIAPAIKRQELLREAELSGSQAAIDVAELGAETRLRTLYFGFLRTFAGERVIDSSRLVLQELLRVNQSLVRNELATSDVVYRTEAELADLDGQLASLLAQRMTAQAAVNRLLNRSLGSQLRNDFAPLDFDTTLAAQNLESLLGLAQNRPELDQVDAGLNTLSALDELQAADGLPTLGVGVLAGSQGFFGTSYDDDLYAIGNLNLTWNLYDGSRRNTQRQITRLRREAQATRRDGIARDLELQIFSTYQNRLAAQARLRASASARRSSLRTLELVEAQYRNEQAILVEYLDARNRWTQSELEYVDAYYELLIAHYELLAAIGG